MASVLEEMEAAGATEDINVDAPPAPRKPRAIKIKGTESKRDRFVRIATPRVQRAVDAIRIVGLLGGTNKYRYDYAPSDIEAITDALNAAVKEAGVKLRREGKQIEMFELPARLPKNGGE